MRFKCPLKAKGCGLLFNFDQLALNTEGLRVSQNYHRTAQKRYKTVVTVKLIVAALVLGWLISAFCTVSIFFSFKFAKIVGDIVIFICIVTSLYCYKRNYITLRQQKLHVQALRSFQVEHYRKSLKSMFIIFCLFLLTYIPFFCILVFVTIEGFGSTSLFILDVSTLIVMANQPCGVLYASSRSEGRGNTCHT